MSKIENIIEPTISFKEDILKIHILYLEKFNALSKGERNAYEKYLNHLSNPCIFIKNGDIDIADV